MLPDDEKQNEDQEETETGRRPASDEVDREEEDIEEEDLDDEDLDEPEEREPA